MMILTKVANMALYISGGKLIQV